MTNVSADEPTYRQAISGPDARDWELAIFSEIEGCIKRDTFSFVNKDTIENRGRLVTAKWVLKRKYNSDMTLNKYKARIVARGFTQIRGLDFNEASATTARSGSWRALMALAAINEWYILQADFVAA